MGATTDLLYHMVKGIPTFAAIEKRAVARATALFLCRMGPSGRPGWACLRLAPTALGSGIHQKTGNGVVGGSVSLTVVVGPRFQRCRGEPQARPSRPAVFARSKAFARGKWSPLAGGGIAWSGRPCRPALPSSLYTLHSALLSCSFLHCSWFSRYHSSRGILSFRNRS